jgi:putative hydrolase
MTQALELGCVFTIDSDAHAPGQLDWLQYGCDRAEECGVPPDRVMNTRTADELLAWTGGGGS